MANDYDLGDLELGDIVGAVRRRRRGGNAMVRQGRPSLRSRIVQQIPGVSNPTGRGQPLGLGSTAFTATSGNALQLTGLPQKPFQAQRLILDSTRTGATATGLVTVSAISVGTDNQLAGQASLSISAFSSIAVDANILFTPAGAGISIGVSLNISIAPTTTDRVDVSGMMFGSTLG